MSRHLDIGDTRPHSSDDGDCSIVSTIDVGGGVRMLRCGTDCDHRYLVDHVCPRGEGEHRIEPIVAIPINPAHVVVSDEPLTITASISCPSCGLHGYVTDGRWIPC